QRCETKSAIGCEQKHDADEAGRHFQPPGKAAVWLPGRPKNDNDDSDQQHQVSPRRAFHFRASSTARLIAAIMLSGRAIFLPAISKAVPWSGLVRGKGRPSVTFTPS